MSVKNNQYLQIVGAPDECYSERINRNVIREYLGVWCHSLVFGPFGSADSVNHRLKTSFFKSQKSLKK